MDIFAPAPSSVHASISSEIHGRLFAYIKQNKGKCKVLTAPFDVCLPNGSLVEAQIATVVQPDICIICDLSNVSERL